MDLTVLHLLSNSIVINLVTKSVLDEGNDRYTCATTITRNDGSFLFLYLLQTSAAVELPAIVLEAQKDVGTTSMKRSIEYCLQVSEKYSYEVYFILLCTDQISRSVKERLLANLDNLYRQQLHSVYWAKTCQFILKATINSDNEDAEQNLNLLAALTLYIASNNEERSKLKDVADSTIQLLSTMFEPVGSEI
ncbi:uncharacterized protein B0P05DRAFT_600535 [Gilbertella persicaria]|uniref:uncharacterized protein n=1 Tax=Gilbertella persicaria TaxID=101096 RepID=UPI00222001D8|nr:uncharacterized protein B0P05DRAFT_600535 [Gilbertella persicaria]KAI8051066.1 hypothetical protein B0P05DRAFT_600535 [Gilbertella persicaria]